MLHASLPTHRSAVFVAGFTRKRGDIVEDGKLLFPELVRGDIRSSGFDLNGCWVPFYNWHKLYAGLFDAQTLCGNEKAIGVATGLGHYRSEEHTSELKSLMRISYAVLCLKKKTSSTR